MQERGTAVPESCLSSVPRRRDAVSRTSSSRNSGRQAVRAPLSPQNQEGVARSRGRSPDQVRAASTAPRLCAPRFRLRFASAWRVVAASAAGAAATWHRCGCPAV